MKYITTIVVLLSLSSSVFSAQTYNYEFTIVNSGNWGPAFELFNSSCEQHVWFTLPKGHSFTQNFTGVKTRCNPNEWELIVKGGNQGGIYQLPIAGCKFPVTIQLSSLGLFQVNCNNK